MIIYLYSIKITFYCKGAGGGHPDLFVKLVFEIAVVQLTRTHYETFEGVLDPNRPPVPQCGHAHIWSYFGPITPNY